MNETDAIRATINFVRTLYFSSESQGGKFKSDWFTDRLKRASSESKLSGFCETLIRLTQPDKEKVNNYAIIEMVAIANSSLATRILLWVRRNANIIVSLALEKNANLNPVIEGIQLPEETTEGVALPRRGFDIGLKIKMEAPLEHGADTKCGNSTMFRRINVCSTDGGTLHLPYYSGNALRGQMRDLLADHFLTAIGVGADRLKPKVALWFFYALYTGGVLTEADSSTKKIVKNMGDNGAIRAEGVWKLRNMIPPISLLGAAIGNRILPGRVRFADLRPVCREWGTGAIGVDQLLEWEFLTRRDDLVTSTDNKSMIANTEVLRAGTELEGGIDIDTVMTAIERSVLGKGIELLQAHGFLGASSRRGFGKCVMEFSNVPGAEEYETLLKDKGSEITAYLKDIDALKEPENE